MGLFDFLKPKEYVASVCHVCGREIAQYNDRKTKDGIICVDCKDAVEALRPGSAYANMTIEEIKDLLSSQGKSEEQLGSCPVCGEKLPALPKKLRDGMICNNCEKKMRYAYFKTTSYKNEYDLNWEEKKMLEAQNAGQLIKSDKLMIFEDEMDILTIDDVKHDLAEDERRISEVPSLFPEYTAVGYYDCMADYQEDDAVWITVLCCKGTINVGDTIIRVEGDIRAEHPVSAIVIPDGYSLEESVESGQSQTLEAGCWGWIRTTGSFVADPNYSGDKYILKKYGNPEMKRKTLTTILICLISTVFIAGCVKDTDNNLKDKLENAAENTEEEDRDSVKSEAEKPVKEKDFSVDLTSQEGILSYLDGEWTLFDRDTGRDFGTLSIQKDGSFEFTRLSDKTMGSGTLSFEYSRSKKGEGPDFFRLDFDECSKLLPAGYEPYGSEGTSGIFHVGTFGNEDYLYLEEIGNGDSVVSMNIFNTKEESELIGDWPRDWLFYRDNNVENPADMIEDDTFYAWTWETDEDGVWLQPMTEHIFETHEEYTDWKYLGGYFNETDNIGIAHYGITNSTDFEGLVNTKGWNSGYPLMMCEVTVDRDYNVTKLRDIDIVMYSSYDMGELEPEFSYNGTTFTVDGYEIDVTADAPAANAITNAKLVGDWIIIDCHINPNISTYLFYNITDGLIDYFEYQIDGANLIWQGDDLSTAVYQQYNDIYDIWGRPIGHIQEGELYELSFKDKNTIVAKCWIVDDIGREKEFTEEFEYEPCDGAVWAYYECMLGGGRQWRRLKDMAGDATALVMVDPPEKILSRMPYPVAFEESALDKVVIVPLVDDATVTIESTMPGDIPGDKKPKETEDVEKGRAIVFDVTVPEGLPAAQITVKAPGYDSAIWDVWQISGRIPQMSTFIK